MLRASRVPGFVKCARTAVCPKPNGHMGRCKLSAPISLEADSEESEEEEETEDDEESESEESGEEEEEAEGTKSEKGGNESFKVCTRHPNCPKPAGHRGACRTRAPPKHAHDNSNSAIDKGATWASTEAEASAQRIADIIAEAIWNWHPRTDCSSIGLATAEVRRHISLAKTCTLFSNRKADQVVIAKDPTCRGATG